MDKLILFSELLEIFLAMSQSLIIKVPFTFTFLINFFLLEQN